MMKRIRQYIYVVLMCLSIGAISHANERDSLSMGISGSWGSYNVLGGEFYFGKSIALFGKDTELKMGLDYRPYALSVDGVSGMDAVSVGVFGDLATYPILGRGLFVGVRWEVINFNSLSETSLSKFEQERSFAPTRFYTGTCVFFQAGYRFQLSDTFCIRLYGQPGVQQFRIGGVGNYVQQIDNENTFAENQYRFIYNVNAGLEIRLK